MTALPELDEPGWTSDDFVRDMPVDYTLLVENLADPDHGLFAHQACPSTLTFVILECDIKVVKQNTR